MTLLLKTLCGGIFVAISGLPTFADQLSDYTSLPMEHFRDTATVKDDDLDTVAQIDTGKGFQTKHGLLGIVWEDTFLRAFVDKKSGKTTYQVYEIIPYQASEWRFYQSVNYEVPGGPVAMPATIIDRSVTGCSYGTCQYTEHVGFDAPEALLRRFALAYVPSSKTGWRYKFNAKAGPDFKDGLSAAEITGCLAAVDNYLASHNLKSSFDPQSIFAGLKPLKFGSFGVTITPEVAKSLKLNTEHGLYITLLQPKSPAEAAGIKVGDLITSFDGKSITSVGDMAKAVDASSIGSTVVVEIFRDGAIQNLKAHL